MMIPVTTQATMLFLFAFMSEIHPGVFSCGKKRNSISNINREVFSASKSQFVGRGAVRRSRGAAARVE